VNVHRHYLLVRADFAIGGGQQGDRLVYHRWRRVLIDALPKLLGCAKRSPRAEQVRLHKGSEQGPGRYSAWLRIPIQRRASSRLIRLIRAKLRDRLEAALRPIQGEVIKFSVRRSRSRSEFMPLFAGPAAGPVSSETPAADEPVVIAEGPILQTSGT
jgi:hypothetical protein